jgi:DNA-binding transcriptional regulator LsrR (DeoR family)
VVGLTWGSSLRAFVESLPRLELPRLQVVQILGGLGSVDAGVNGAELTRRLAERCGARPRMIQAPGVVASREVREALLADPEVAEALALGARADLAVVGIGVPRPTPASTGPGSLLGAAELEALRRRGAVGDIAFRHFDAAGRWLDTELDDRVVGLDPAALARIPRRIAVAGGPDKTAAIAAALAGRLVDVLVTDEDTAAALLAGGADAAATGAAR